MRLRTLVPALTLLAVGAPLAAQNNFEGSITYQVSVPRGTNMTMTMSVKGTHFRSDMSLQGGSFTLLSEVGSSVLTMVMTQQRMFMKIDPNNMNPMMAGMMRGMAQSKPQPNATVFKATGQTETIAGKSCEHYTGTEGTTTIDVCAAKGMGFLTMVPTGGLTPPPSAAQVEAYRAMFADGFVPLKIVATEGSNITTILATALDQTTLSDDHFQPPAGFTELKIP
jgi:hypothetical protein